MMETGKRNIRIKICGITREEEIPWMNELLPDYVGFVFAKGRRRTIEPERAARFRLALDPAVKTVGVFVNEDPAAVARLLNTGVIDLAQLHGQEDRGYVALLRMLTDRPVICAVQADTPGALAYANTLPADYVLLDHGRGGTGESFDWSVLGGMERPFFLAGGLSPENAESAVEKAGRWLYGVDVSSGVETDGVKDYNKVKAFIDHVRMCG